MFERYAPDNKAHGANMGPIWGRHDPGGPHVVPMNLAIWARYWLVENMYLILVLTSVMSIYVFNNYPSLPFCGVFIILTYAGNGQRHWFYAPESVPMLMECPHEVRIYISKTTKAAYIITRYLSVNSNCAKYLTNYLQVQLI